MPGLCQYRDVFGKPGEGAHSVRIGGVAIVDVALTAVAAAGVSWALGQSFVVVLVLLLIVAVAMHRLFCVDTAVNRWLFGPTNDAATFYA